MTFGQRLKEVRKACGFNQTELGELSGVSMNTISAYERDVIDPTLFNITCIADVLEVSLDYLVGRKVE